MTEEEKQQLERMIEEMHEKYQIDPYWNLTIYSEDVRYIPHFSRYKMSMFNCVVDQETGHTIYSNREGNYHIEDDNGKWCYKYWKDLTLSTFTLEEIKKAKLACKIGFMCDCHNNLDRLKDRMINKHLWDDTTLNFHWNH